MSWQWWRHDDPGMEAVMLRSLYQIRTIRGNPGAYRVTKYDERYHATRHYGLFVYKNYQKLICTCIAGENLKPCRHKFMFRIFEAEFKIDSGYFYDPETKSWEMPVNHPVRLLQRKLEKRNVVVDTGNTG